MKTLDKVCLRCDWEGETREHDCPACGTALWLPRQAGGPPARRWPPAWFPFHRHAGDHDAPASARTRELEQVITFELPPDQEVATHDRRRSWLPVTVVLVVAIVAVAVIRTGAPSAPPAPLAAALGGQILYAAPDDTEQGWYRLWIWDVGAGSVDRGARLHEPLQLIDMTAIANNVIGSVSATPDGFSIDTLRHLGVADTATSVLRGTFVAWAPGGRLAVAIDKDDGCGEVAFVTYVAANQTTSSDRLAETCASLAGVGATTPHQYVSLAEGGPPWIDRITFLGVDRVAKGFLPVGASNSDLFVLSADEVNDVAVGPALSVLTFPPGPFRQPLPVGEAGRTFAFEAVLAATEGADALVLGAYDGERGIWAIPEAESDARVIPTLVLATDAANVGATTAGDGAVVAMLDGRAFVIVDGVSNELELPRGAPDPLGAVLWIEQELA